MEAKKIIITGGSQGIGKSIAKKLLEAGFDCHILARTKEKLESTVNELSGFGNIDYTQLDLGNRVELQKFCNEFTGEIYGLVNNAGICKTERLDEDYDVWDEVIDTNLNGVYFLTKYLIEKIVKNGRIVNVSSQLGKEGRAGYSAYCASKFAINGMTKCWAKELGVKGITVNAICPGWVKTEMSETDLKRIAEDKGIDHKDFYKEICEPLELKRFTEPDEVANLVAWLISKEASGVTGRSWLLNTIWNQE